jgi:hypothetical protein
VLQQGSAPAGSLEPAWVSLDDEALLSMRMCDLGLTLEGSGLEPRLRELEGELAARGLAFRPHFWLSDEWFCPDGVPGVAIPFYLAHPRLMRLEQSQMLEVEGGTHDWCLKILRHEAGHAIENAYRLRLRKTRRELFGRSSEPYPEYYLPKPYSKSYVIHLDAWYAQSHPDEDFAETFAVWLTPDSDWRARYAGWPALRKLEYVEELMCRIRDRHPPVDNRDFYDRDLNRLFGPGSTYPNRPRAAPFVGRIRREVRRRVARWTGTYQYTIDQVLKDIIKRSGEMDLRVVRSEEETKLEFIILLTVQTMNYLSSGRHRMAL